MNSSRHSHSTSLFRWSLLSSQQFAPFLFISCTLTFLAFTTVLHHFLDSFFFQVCKAAVCTSLSLVFFHLHLRTSSLLIRPSFPEFPCSSSVPLPVSITSLTVLLVFFLLFYLPPFSNQLPLHPLYQFHYFFLSPRVS